jgi:hypothetical protein
VFLRGLVTSYLLASFGADLKYDLTTLDQGYSALFDLSNISYGVQALYATIAFVSAYPIPVPTPTVTPSPQHHHAVTQSSQQLLLQLAPIDIIPV